MMRRGAGLDANQARRQLLEERQYIAALELTTDDDLAIRIDAVNLKNRLCDVETDCRDRLHDLAPPNRGGLNSTHIHGTHVPVEEPSTASKADVAVCGTAIEDVQEAFASRHRSAVREMTRSNSSAPSDIPFSKSSSIRPI